MKNLLKKHYSYIIIVAVLMLPFNIYSQTNFTDSSEVFINKKTPFFEAYTMDGVYLNSDSLLGKIVVLNFWDTYCKPCIAEMPELYKIYTDYKDSGLVFISACKSEETATLAIKRHAKINFDIVANSELLNISYNIHNTYPTTILINKEGIVTSYFIGASPEYLRICIEKLFK